MGPVSRAIVVAACGESGYHAPPSDRRVECVDCNAAVRRDCGGSARRRHREGFRRGLGQIRRPRHRRSASGRRRRRRRAPAPPHRRRLPLAMRTKLGENPAAVRVGSRHEAARRHDHRMAKAMRLIDDVEDRRPRLSAQALPSTVDLSILLVTWNSARWIERCLQSIPAACEGLDYEVVVYDNGSTDDTLPRLNGDVQIMRSKTNDGFAAGINRAFTASRGKYVFLLNPDCELEPKALTRLHAFLESEPNAAAAVPLLEDDDG